MFYSWRSYEKITSNPSVNFLKFLKRCLATLLGQSRNRSPIKFLLWAASNYYPEPNKKLLCSTKHWIQDICLAYVSYISTFFAYWWYNISGFHPDVRYLCEPWLHSGCSPYLGLYGPISWPLHRKILLLLEFFFIKEIMTSSKNWFHVIHFGANCFKKN
jgi:hypothetical protein